ncbi:hypothetical protein ES708_24846 [subsurface metagenome]
MVMLGFLQEKTKVVSLDALEKAIADLVPSKTLDLNLKALQIGANIAKKMNSVVNSYIIPITFLLHG